MRKRRFGLLLAVFFSTSLTVGAKELVCTSPMAGMGAVEGAATSDNSKPADHAPCDASKVPVSCATSSGCVSNALTVALAAQAPAPGVASSIAVLKVGLPASRSTTPEPPPPRV